jgi:hypothetical protein
MKIMSSPGQMLYLVQEIPKKVGEDVQKLREDGVSLQYRMYGILEAESIISNRKLPNAGKGWSALRTTAVSLSSPPADFMVALDRSY